MSERRLNSLGRIALFGCGLVLAVLLVRGCVLEAQLVRDFLAAG
jgi:hypothetical protein